MKLWNAIKVHDKWIFFAILLGMGGWSLANGDPSGAVVSFVVAFAVLAILHLLSRTTTRIASATARAEIYDSLQKYEELRRAGAEPLPIPGETCCKGGSVWHRES